MLRTGVVRGSVSFIKKEGGNVVTKAAAAPVAVAGGAPPASALSKFYAKKKTDESVGGGHVTFVREGEPMPEPEKLSYTKQGVPSPRGPAPAEYDGPKIVLMPPRAVTAEEAPMIRPAMESTKVTMMPWKGWFQRFLRENYPAAYKKFREVMFFDPDNTYDLIGAPLPTKKVYLANDPNYYHMYRYPSPGSQKPAKYTNFAEDGDPYDNGYFKIATDRRYEFSENLVPKEIQRLRIEMMGDPEDPAVKKELARIEAGPRSSPGNKGVFATGPTDFDPTGLRATGSVTWAALEKKLDSRMPNHLPEPIWFSKRDEIIAWYKEIDVPPPIGGYYEPLALEKWQRVARW